MKSEDLLEMLQNARMAVFTSKDIERLTRKDITYTSLYISRLVARHKLIKIEKGKYCQFDTNAYEIASNIVFPSYISLFAAFSLYGLTTQGPIMIIDVMTTKRHRKINFGSYTLKFITIDRSRLFGFQRTQNEIMVALPEKAIVDAVYFSDPNEAYISEAVENGLKKKLLKVERLKDFAEKMRSRKTVAKINSLLAEMGELA
jgi:predicted transcriptional regulator of viral defense system